MDTYFAPSERTDTNRLNNQIETVSNSPIMDALLKTMYGLLVVLNEDRQLVAINKTFLESIGIQDASKALGLRLGEALQCIHANEYPNGCGTTQYCSSCGAAIAMVTAINENKSNEQICALTTGKDGVTDDLCLMIRAKPVIADGSRWILVFAQDITQQQFWVSLERVFFHDINNILSALMGNVQLLDMNLPDNQRVKKIKEVSERLCAEILLQKSLSQKKDVSYLMHKSEFKLDDVKNELEPLIKYHKAANNKKIEEICPNPDTDSTKFFTDRLLISRVLGNMVINALEATKEGDSIKLITIVEPDAVVWEVHNNDVIPEDVQKRIFQKHFSTKSNMGRGLGTYSMKLFGEKYLNGKIDFTSTKDKGTIFKFRLPLR